MNYGKRITVLIVIWVLSLLTLMGSLAWSSLNHSVENNIRNIESALNKVDEELPFLVVDDAYIRTEYYEELQAKGKVVPILQEYGLEDAVPSRKDMRQYARLIGASYISIEDRDGKTVVSSGKKHKNEDDIGSLDENTEFTAEKAVIVTVEQKPFMGFTHRLKDGYTLYYEVDCSEENAIGDETISWKSILKKTTLPNDAAFTVVLKDTGDILVHPDDDLTGKNVTDIGYGSVEEFRESFGKPDKNDISWNRNDLDDTGYTSIRMGTSVISGMIDMDILYVICSVKERSVYSYILQTYRTLPILFGIGTFFILCYILFYFSDRRRKDGGADTSEYIQDEHDGSYQEDQEIVSRGGFSFDLYWARHLAVCCIIVIIAVITLTVHFQLLSNMSQANGQETLYEKLTKDIKSQNKETAERLDEWYNKRNIELAKLVSFTAGQSEELKERPALKKLAGEYGLDGIYIFGKDGVVKETSTDFDHLDLYRDEESFMSRAFIPLLDGFPESGWTPLTEESAGTMEAYAGVSVRDEKDLADGCIGIVRAMSKIFNDTETSVNLFKASLKWAKGTEDTGALLSSSQLWMTGTIIIWLLITTLLMYLTGVLMRRQEPAEGTEVSGDGAEASGEHDAGGISSGTSSGPSVSEDQGNQDYEELFFAMARKDKDKDFFQRWNINTVKFRYRTPEQKLAFMVRLLLVISAAMIVFMYVTRGGGAEPGGISGNLFSGNWDRGFNLYAVTAAGMILIVATVATMVLHRLIFLIAFFSSSRGETICKLISSLITYVMVFVAVFYSLLLFGIDARTLLASAGVLAAIIGFGARELIEDIFAGIFLIFEDVIHVGDFVVMGDTVGIVMSIGVRMTKIKYFATVVSVNNAEVKNLKNLSGGNERVKCLIKIDFAEDLQHVEDVINRELPALTERLNETGYILSDIHYDNVTSVDDTGYTIRLTVMCYSWRNRRVFRLLNAEVLKMLYRNNIRIAYSHVVVEHPIPEKDMLPGIDQLPEEEQKKIADEAKK